jgi:putative hemolysin
MVVACALLAACTQSESGTPMDFSKACALENEKKVVEINGFLSAAGSVFCSNRGGRMECGFKFTEAPGAGKGITAYVEQGSGANTVDKLKSGYKREDVKIRDNAGNLINLSEKIKLTGKLNVTPDLSVCFIDVTKIER